MKLSALIPGAACALLLLWSCGAGHNHETGHDHDIHHTEAASDHDGEDPHDHESAHGHAGEAGHSDEIVIAPEKAEAAGIVAEAIAPETFSGVIRTGGQILPALGDEKNVVATTDGIVSFSGNLFEGSDVANGQAMFSILSGNIQDGNRIGKAKVAYETAKAEYERAAGLVDSQIVSQKEFIRIKEAYENARMAYEALKPNADGTGVQIESPFAGCIRDIFVSEGDFVTMGTPLACVAQDRNLILRADVSQRHFSQLQDISSANFSTQYDEQAYNIKELGGRLIATGLSPQVKVPRNLHITFPLPSNSETMAASCPDHLPKCGC